MKVKLRIITRSNRKRGTGFKGKKVIYRKQLSNKVGIKNEFHISYTKNI